MFNQHYLLINAKQINFSASLFAFTIVVAFYTFGTFGFFNLFSLRVVFQIGVFLFSLFGLISIYSSLVHQRLKYNRGYIFFIIFGLLYYGVVYSLTEQILLNGLVQTILMVVIFLYISFATQEVINIISKSIIILSFIFTIMGFIAYFNFLADPFIVYNINIYDSTVGNSTIYPSSWVEYFSFTSGDGFNFFGTQLTRLKGFCNEPSATVVHYLAPAALALLYSKQYRIMGFTMLLFNLLAISSLIGILIIFGSLIIYVLFLIKNRIIISIILGVSIMVLILLMLNANFAESLILDMGNSLYEQTSYDLIARKNGSTTERLLSFSIALQEFKNNPLGWSSYNSMTGLLLNASLKGGIFIFCILGILFFQIIKHALIKFNQNCFGNVYKLGIALIISTLIAAFLLSGYGWDRIPGIIMLMLFYRNLKD